MIIESILITCVLAGADSAAWPMNVSTSGEHITWQSSSSIRPNADTYGCFITVDYAEATVLWGGIEWGPFDVSDQIPSEVFDSGADGPCATTFGTEQFITPEPPGPVTLAFDLRTDLQTSGVCDILIDNVVLGTADYDLGWPIGTVNVQLVSMSFESTVHVDAFGIDCVGDTDGSGTVDVVDVLDLLASWGNCSGDCSGDINGDGLVDVVDLLAMLGAWGPCA
jgi:hypothetical protein